jgi:hypothetical protein
MTSDRIGYRGRAVSAVLGTALLLSPGHAWANADDLIRLGIGVGTILMNKEIERQRAGRPERPQRAQRREERQERRQDLERSSQTASTVANVTAQLQRKLTDLGLDPGPVDGSWGRKTENALRQWQGSIGEQPTGVLTDAQRIILSLPAAAGGSGTASADQAGEGLVKGEGADAIATAPLAATPAGWGGVPPGLHTPENQWYGELRCTRRGTPQPAEIEAKLRPRADGNFDFLLVGNYPDSLNEGTTRVSYIGEVDRADPGKRRFVVANTRGNVMRLKVGSFVLQSTEGGRLKGIFSDGDCQDFDLRPAAEATERFTPTVADAADGGTFWAARTDRDRCEALIAWTGRLAREYPGVDFYRQSRRGDDWHKILLFGDDDFVPVFGKPFDQLALKRRVEVTRFSQSVCRQDPFTKVRIEPFYAAADRPLDDNEDRQLTSDGYSSTVFAVRKIRTLRHGLRALELTAVEGQPFAEANATLSAFKSTLSRDQATLWPSEVTNTMARIDGRLAALARVEAATALAAWKTPGDVDAGQWSASDALLAYLPAPEQEAFRRQLGDAQARKAEELTARLVAEARAAPVAMAGVATIEAIRKGAEKLMADIPVAGRKQVLAWIDTERDVRLSNVAAQRLAELKQYPEGLQGLDLSRAWYGRLDVEMASHRAHPDVKKLHEAFRDDRRRRLRGGVAEFETALVTAEDKPALLARYLSMPLDRNEPISLDYLFAGLAQPSGRN